MSTVVKAGYLAAAYLGAVKISGIGTWSYSGETRNMVDNDEFGDEYITQTPCQVVGGDISISGHYLVDTDAGQKAIKTAFDAKTASTDLKLYTDKDNNIYLTPKAGSSVICTNVNNTGVDKAGVGTFSATWHVNGELEQAGSTTVGAVDTIGIHALIATEASFVGELVSMGGLTPWACYFEYGTTIAYGTDTVATKDDLTAVGLFEGTSGLLVTATTYHWRIKVTATAGAVVVYGPDQTFTTP